MNNQVKILLNIQGIPGGTIRVTDVEKEEEYTRKGKRLKRKVIVKENKVIPASQTIKITQDAYDYFTSTECPPWIHNPKKWKKLTQRMRLEEHLSRMCMDRGGQTFTYSILDD